MVNGEAHTRVTSAENSTMVVLRICVPPIFTEIDPHCGSFRRHAISASSAGEGSGVTVVRDGRVRRSGAALVGTALCALMHAIVPAGDWTHWRQRSSRVYRMR